MKNICLLPVLMFTFILSSCDYFFPPLSGDKIDADEAHTFITKHRGDDDVVILDVRTKEEYDKGHIENAVLIDFKQTDFPDKIEKLNRDKRYILYSNSSIRSSMTFELMKELRFEKVHVIKGGFDEWKSKGY